MATTPTYLAGTVALDRSGTAWQKQLDGMWRSADNLETEESHIRREFEQGWLKFVHIPGSGEYGTLRRWLELHLERYRYSNLSTPELADDIMLLIKEAEVLQNV